MVDLELIDFLIFLFKDRKGNIFLLLNFVSSLFITVFCYYSEINSHFNSKVAKHNSNKVKRTIVIRFNSLIKNIKMPKSKIRKSVFVDRLVLMIIFIFFILALLSYAALIGYDNAKSNKEFWLVTNNIDKNETFIRLYSDNDKMILSPYTIASNSIIIYNSSIIIKPNNDYIVSRIKCKTVELESKHSNKIY